MSVKINVERVYADPDGHEPSEGFRVYVDRLWPRGESKAKFHYDLWAKDVSPSTELRQWFHEDPDNRWPEFERRYTAELAANPATATLLATLKGYPVITLLYSSRDTAHNNALVIASYLRSHLA